MALLATSCATNSPRSFERVVTQAENKGAQYSQEDWSSADAQYEEFVEKYGDTETLKRLTPEERKEVGRLAARYLKVRMQFATGQMKELMEVGADMSSGFLEELNLDGSNGEPGLMNEMEELMNEFNSLFDIE